jgi:N-methylhydantoinase B
VSIADRSILSSWGVKGGRAGRPFEVTIDPDGGDERRVDALAEAEPVRAGEVIRIRTTGGGGWGDPVERPVDEVARDVRWGKVSVTGALDDYGVVLARHGDGTVTVDERQTRESRDAVRARRPARSPFFDRGSGFPQLAAGATHAEVDFLQAGSTDASPGGG